MRKMMKMKKAKTRKRMTQTLQTSQTRVLGDARPPYCRHQRPCPYPERLLNALQSVTYALTSPKHHSKLAQIQQNTGNFIPVCITILRFYKSTTMSVTKIRSDTGQIRSQSNFYTPAFHLSTSYVHNNIGHQVLYKVH